MRIHSRGLPLLAILLGCAGDPPPPNVVLITLDTTRADHLGCYGYDKPTSPNLDALAAESVLFTRAYSTSSWTLPAHASLFTGRFPASHGARYDSEGPLKITSAITGPEHWDQYRARGISPSETTLAEVLTGAGYDCGAFVAGPWLKRVFGLDEGFAHYDDSGISETNGRPASDVTESAIQWLEAGGERPFMLFLNYYDPHFPLQPPASYERRFVPRDGPELSELERTLALYDAEIRFMDHHMGQLLRHLRKRGLYENTWVVVTADHGELLGENERIGHGRYLSEAELHVPLLVKDPSPTPSSQRVDALVQVTDVMPYLLQELGLAIPEAVQGDPLFDVRHPIVAEVHPLPIMNGAGDWQALLHGDVKFAWNSAGDHNLFNVLNDPSEGENLLPKHPELGEAMGQTLKRFIEALPEPGAAGPVREVDEETQRVLRNLGYLGNQLSDGARNATVALGLVLASMALYGGVGDFAFLTLDDGSYVYGNGNVRPGLSWKSARWAFTRSFSSNWHPLTWLSHMLDSQLFGMQAGKHHLMSAGLHAFNGALLFLALRAMRAAFWPAACVAALFALHPLRVESVAWVSERKDVLSGFFWMLTLLAYASYAQRRGVARYLLVCLCFALGLMAKPMLVTLPCVLLLLDHWPLRREERASRLILEKLPLLALAAASSVVTAMVQAAGGALQPLAQISLEARLSNSVSAVSGYLTKTLWPNPLAPFYPHPAITQPEAFEPWSMAVLVSAAALFFVSALAVIWRVKRPYLFVGWFWMLGTLVPVIGIVQVGEQALADRYTYLPLIGFSLALAFAAHELSQRLPALRRALWIGVPLALMLLAGVTRNQIAHWRDSFTLFEHTLAVTERNYAAHFNLGVAYESEGELEEARHHYERTLEILPRASDAHYNLGVLAMTHDPGEAEAHFRRAIELGRATIRARINLGIALAELGRNDEARAELEGVLADQPRAAEAHAALGGMSARSGNYRGAVEHYGEAVRHKPSLRSARFLLGVALFEIGELERATEELETVLRAEPDHPQAKGYLERARRRAKRKGA